MNIALCTDEKYSFPCGVCITSILENNKEEECNIYILTEGLEPQTIEKFRSLERKYNQRIIIKRVDSCIFSNLKICNRFPKSIYFRFMLPELIDHEKKILYFDCDIIVTGSLKDLWETEISEYACGVVEDQKSDDITIQNRLGLYKDYFNSGVLLINLEYWREKDIANKLIEFIHQNPDICLYPDQDALNYVLCDRVKFLDYKYNYQELFYQPKEHILLHKNKWEKLDLAGSTPTIMHYTGCIKPWVKACPHPYKELFIKYQAISPWKDKKIRSRYTIKWKIAGIIEQIKYYWKN